MDSEGDNMNKDNLSKYNNCFYSKGKFLICYTKILQTQLHTFFLDMKPKSEMLKEKFTQKCNSSHYPSP